MDQKTQDIVLAFNPWIVEPERWKKLVDERLPERFIERSSFSSLLELWQATNKAHLLVGPRQAGKTTLIWRYLAEIGPRVLFLSLEDPRIREWCASPAVFVRDLKQRFAPLEVLFLDEIQHLREAALFLKGVIDLRPGCHVLVTGSSSFHLRSKTRESLAGRATRTTLLPLSLAELAASSPASGAGGSAAGAEAELRRLFERHVRFGGYPEIWGHPIEGNAERILDQLVAAFLQRDASDAYKIRRPDAINRLLALMARQTGSLVNFSEWGAHCAISKDTVIEYAKLLEDAHLIELLPVFAQGKRVELTASIKVYFVDGGIRNSLLRDFRAPEERVDGGQVLETWVYSELRKRLGAGERLAYWRTRAGAEVDFVVESPKTLVGIEVKAEAMRAPKLSRSARSFIEAYQPARFLVLNATLDHSETIGSSQVHWTTFTAFATTALLEGSAMQQGTDEQSAE